MNNFKSIKVQDLSDRFYVELNRPEQKNAINLSMVQELHQVCEYLESTPKPLLIYGAGGNFAAGADITELLKRGEKEALEGINSSLFDRIANLPMPVIAVLEGYVLGGGAELAYAADIRLGTHSLKIGNPETNLGIIAAAGATYRLPQIVGRSFAKLMLFTGCVLGAEEALNARLVAKLYDSGDVFEEANNLIDQILRGSLQATEFTKLAINTPFNEHPNIDNKLQAVLFESEEKHKRMEAFLRRKSYESNARN